MPTVRTRQGFSITQHKCADKSRSNQYLFKITTPAITSETYQSNTHLVDQIEETNHEQRRYLWRYSVSRCSATMPFLSSLGVDWCRPARPPRYLWAGAAERFATTATGSFEKFPEPSSAEPRKARESAVDARVCSALYGEKSIGIGFPEWLVTRGRGNIAVLRRDAIQCVRTSSP